MAIEIVKQLEHYAWWELAIFIIGIVSFFAVLVILFFPLGTGPDKFTETSSIPAVSSPEFLSILAATLNLPTEKGEEIKILNNGDEFLPALLTDIDNAKSSINIMLYIWDKGTMSDQVFEHLDAKLKEGVEVRLMLDAFGALGATKRDEFKKFKELGGKVEIFHSLTIAPWNIFHNHKRNHQRAIAIDGEISYAGGMAISDKWLGDARNKDEWRDMMFRTMGPMATDIQGMFATQWASSTGEILAGEKFYPSVKTALAPNKNSLTYIPLVSTPSPDSLMIEKFILLSLLGAREKIYITTPYFLPNSSLSDALIKKAKDGLDVRILVPNDFNDSHGVRHASQHSYEGLLEAGVKIYEYQPTFIHAKAIVIDGDWSIIGSANMDNRSRLINEENIFGISDPAFGAQLEKIFSGDLEHSKKITLSEWRKRGIWQRFQEVSALKFVQQY